VRTVRRRQRYCRHIDVKEAARATCHVREQWIVGLPNKNRRCDLAEGAQPLALGPVGVFSAPPLGGVA
jgi:hypothetical protein